MKKLYLLAALLMASTAAHAGNAVSLQIGGHKIRIEAPKNCDKLSCLQISAPGLSGSDLSFKGFKSSRDDDEVAARTDPPAQKATAAPVEQAPAPQPPVAAASSAPSTSTEVASTSAPSAICNTEKNGGMVRIEQCGQNLCGNAVPNGEKILINMKPSDKKWTGRIHDPDSGKVYDSSIAMKGPNTLRVQGCVFGGIFCGGQTWNRVS
jgi:uncharacterized protein (DUF2147 family)